MLPPPLPGLQNVLSSSRGVISYLSATSHTLLPSTTRSPVHVHAVHDHVIAYATSHVHVETRAHTIRLPQRLHFRPIHLALHATTGATPTATVVVAGPDGALSATVDLTTSQITTPLYTLPGSAGYAIMCVALNHALVVAASADGRFAIWDDPHAPAREIVDITASSTDRVTDFNFVEDGLLIAWWSGRLVLYGFGKRTNGRKRANGVLWDLQVVKVGQTVYGIHPGCYVCVRGSAIAFVTGRGDLLFVRVSDGAYVVKKLSGYVKGMCDDSSLNLVVNGSLLTCEWITPTELDQTAVPIPTKKDNTNPKRVATGKAHRETY